MSKYLDALDAGYDGLSPFEEKRMAARRRNNPSDCRDPDHEPCEICSDNDEWEEE